MRYPANELWGNREPLCPYCKKKQDTDDLSGHDGDEQKLECSDCGKKFFCQTIVVIEYSTMGSCEENGELPHVLKTPWHGGGSFDCTKCRGEFYDWDLEGGKYQRLTKDKYVILEKDQDQI